MFMPGMNGECNVRALRNISPLLSVIFVSGDIELEYDCIKTVGNCDILYKPFTINPLLQLVHRRLSRIGVTYSFNNKNNNVSEVAEYSQANTTQ